MRLTKFTAGLLALSIATAGISAAPARAGDNDAALALGGLLTLFVIGKALDDRNDNKVKVTQPRPDKDRTPGRDWGHEYRIPNQCVVSAGYGNKHRLVALENCIERQTPKKARVHLPRACETRVQTRQGKQDAYDVGCLNNFGYRIDRDRDRDHGYSRR
ncbi:hypothetical protein [Celeribacter naphthalenivorans]|uniref:hypothetical protein n=1 Tax=Celeribacter naphthalenivorans TaxID=1614694 RepID=UPI001CF9FC05|nr:hypothetical protein [Celeribacter naphthalenivorans]